MRQLLARPITAEAFAAYGWVEQADGQPGRPINGGSSLRVDGVGELALTAEHGAPCLAVFRAQARDPQGPWQQLERHRLGTQTFVPMGGAHGGVRYVVLVALGAQAPEPDTLAAFVVHAQQAVTLRAGTWHHGLIALDAGDFVVIERSAPQVDCELATLAQPVTLQLAL
ncbi:MAG: ureidoglycolate lyase [Burkholderiaceae bacterium]|nr:ureidoglycolate lyase [Burkholderiaceae bacterium]